MTKRSQKTKTIYITEPDYHRLSALIEKTRETNGTDREYLNKLEAELDRAQIVDPKEIPANVITMRSTVRLKDLVSGVPSAFKSNAYTGRPVVAVKGCPLVAVGVPTVPAV